MHESMEDSFHSINEIFHSISYFNNSIFHTEIFLPFYFIFHSISFHSKPCLQVQSGVLLPKHYYDSSDIEFDTVMKI